MSKYESSIDIVKIEALKSEIDIPSYYHEDGDIDPKRI